MNWLLSQVLKQLFQMILGGRVKRSSRSFYVFLGLALGLIIAMMRERNVNVMDPVTDAVGEMGITNPIG